MPPVTFDALHCEVVLTKLGNECGNAMGKRMIREWLLYPFTKVDSISQRHTAITALVQDSLNLSRLSDGMAKCVDFRIVAVKNLEHFVVLAEGIQKTKSMMEAATHLLPKHVAEYKQCLEELRPFWYF